MGICTFDQPNLFWKYELNQYIRSLKCHVIEGIARKTIMLFRISPNNNHWHIHGASRNLHYSTIGIYASHIVGGFTLTQNLLQLDIHYKLNYL